MEYESLSAIRARRAEEKYGRGTLSFVVGMQYGSEAKGSIVQHLAPGVSNAVRTGAVNAGHTIYHRGEAHVMRQLPSAWSNPHTKLILGAGALISPEILKDEIDRYDRLAPGIHQRILIDRNAHVITEEQIEDEAKLDLAERIGSTSSRGREGIGVAMADKVLRSLRCIQAKDYAPLRHFTTDTAEYMSEQLDRGIDVLVEGTQGYGLSIDYGDFPYVTSRNVTVPALADSVGLNPSYYVTQTIGVVRSYPIRVAGNSGPFPEDSRELSWEEMQYEAMNPALPIEKTTVTGLPRRIATFSEKQFLEACRVNQPTEIALTFADYIDPDVYNAHSVDDSVNVQIFINDLEDMSGVPVTLVNTGPNATIDFDYYRFRRLQRMKEIQDSAF